MLDGVELSFCFKVLTSACFKLGEGRYSYKASLLAMAALPSLPEENRARQV